MMKEANHQETYSSGIYHGLPTFNAIGQTAIVCGSNGLSGQAMLKVLLAHPDRWTSIYALSQGPPLKGGVSGPAIHHVAVDFLNNIEHIASVLAANDVNASYVFFFSYKETAEPAVMEQENGTILSQSAQTR
jgi:hypothetical protein